MFSEVDERLACASPYRVKPGRSSRRMREWQQNRLTSKFGLCGGSPSYLNAVSHGRSG